ncbi:hypothetical protein AHAS_Ahas04G0050200 [Arachis hypogaea]
MLMTSPKPPHLTLQRRKMLLPTNQSQSPQMSPTRRRMPGTRRSLKMLLPRKRLISPRVTPRSLRVTPRSPKTSPQRQNPHLLPLRLRIPWRRTRPRRNR